MRSKRPPALSFLLRMDTARRAGRVILLLALDFAGVALAIFTALALKELVLGSPNATHAYEETRHFIPFAYLLTALLFARSGLYAARSQRPGLSRIVGSLFQVAFVALLFAVVSGEQFSSFYIFWGSLAFALLYVSLLRAGYEAATGMALRAAGYRSRAVLVGTGEHISDVAHALGEGTHHAPLDVVGYLSLRPLPDNGLRCMGALADLDEVLKAERIDEVIIADSDFPQLEAVELVDRCHRRGVRVRIAPSTMEILIHRAEFVPGQRVPLFELGPPVFEGIDFALKRTFDLIGATLLLILLSPLLALIVLAVRVSSRGPVVFHSTRRGIGQRPFPCLKFRTMHTDAEQRQADLEEFNEASGALFKIREDPRLTAGGAGAAPVLAGRAAPARERDPRRDVARRSATAARARLRDARGLAPQALSRAARDHRAVAGLRARRARLRRSRAPGLHLPRALVAGAGPDDPAQDAARGDLPAWGILTGGQALGGGLAKIPPAVEGAGVGPAKPALAVGSELVVCTRGWRIGGVRPPLMDPAAILPARRLLILPTHGRSGRARALS